MSKSYLIYTDGGGNKLPTVSAYDQQLDIVVGKPRATPSLQLFTLTVQLALQAEQFTLDQVHLRKSRVVGPFRASLITERIQKTTVKAFDLPQIHLRNARSSYAPGFVVPWWDPIPTGERRLFMTAERGWDTEAETRFRISVRGRI